MGPHLARGSQVPMDPHLSRHFVRGLWACRVCVVVPGKNSQKSALLSFHNVKSSVSDVSEVSSILIAQRTTKCLKCQLYSHFTMYNKVSEKSALLSFHNVKSSVSKCQLHTHSTMYNEEPLVIGLFLRKMTYEDKAFFESTFHIVKWRATSYRSLLRKMTYEHKAFFESTFHIVQWRATSYRSLLRKMANMANEDEAFFESTFHIVQWRVIWQCEIKCLRYQLYHHFTMYNKVSQKSALQWFHLSKFGYVKIWQCHKTNLAMWHIYIYIYIYIHIFIYIYTRM